MFTARIESVYSNHSYATNLSSSDSLSLNSVLYRYFGGTVSADKLDSLLVRYGIKATGNVDSDIEALYSAMYGSATVKSNSAVSQNNKSEDSPFTQTIPWADVMSQVGLAASGDIAEDRSRFYTKISEMQRSVAASGSQQANINQLLAQASVAFVEAPVQEKAKAPTVSGAQIAALMNKQFFFGGSMSA